MSEPTPKPEADPAAPVVVVGEVVGKIKTIPDPPRGGMWVYILAMVAMGAIAILGSVFKPEQTTAYMTIAGIVITALIPMAKAHQETMRGQHAVRKEMNGVMHVAAEVLADKRGAEKRIEGHNEGVAAEKADATERASLRAESHAQGVADEKAERTADNK